MLRRVISSLCGSALALAFCIAVPGYAQSSSSNSKSMKSSDHSQTQAANSKDQTSQSNPQQKMQVSKEAVHALRLTDQARQALINKDQNRASSDVDQALGLLNQVEQKMPVNKNDNTHVVPIFAELEQTSFLQPVLTAKGQSQGQQQSAANNGAKSNSSSSNPQSASNSQPSSSSGANTLPQSDQPPANAPEVVKGVEGGFSYIALDVDAAREHLQAAKQALKNNDPGKADLELARAQESVDTGTIATNMPLVRARENLSLARSDVKNSSYSQAKADLTAAANALKDYAKDTQAPHAQDASKLSGQVQSAASSIQSSRTASSQKIDNWWNQLANWTGQKSS
jgi:hypothetical protein